MVELIIRDDDLNFFTKYEDVEKVYKEIEGFPVSFAAIPEVTDISRVGKCPETKGNKEPQWIGNNSELVMWMKEKLSKGKIDVLMHGLTHGYKPEIGKQDAEMQWRDEKELLQEIKEQKARMQDVLNYPITVFVAPSNKISKYGIKCVEESGLNFSGIIPLQFQREMTLLNIRNYIKRFYVRALYRIPYPGVLKYSNHLELNACVVGGFDYLEKIYSFCDNKNLPMAINVHYWHMRDYPNNYKDFFRFIHWAIEKGACPARMSDVFKKYSE